MCIRDATIGRSFGISIEKERVREPVKMPMFLKYLETAMRAVHEMSLFGK
jgi:hypothetical protein